jgi:hypothetical protein
VQRSPSAAAKRTLERGSHDERVLVRRDGALR